MKKSGFTMIELIFVIVILGVLAAVAIPKLNATRDDAEQAKAMTNLATLMGDLTSYYTAQGTFADNISSMTNVPLAKGTNDGEVDYMIKNEKCLTFKTAGAALIITPNTAATQKVCQNVLTNKSTQNTIRGTYTCDTAITTNESKALQEPTAIGDNDKNLPKTLKDKCTANTATNGIPADRTAKTTYHHTLTTALGDSQATPGTKATEISDYAPVVMSFEGAGVAF